jgi:hypothetical protein
MLAVQHGKDFALNRGVPVPAGIFLHAGVKHDKEECLWQVPSGSRSAPMQHTAEAQARCGNVITHFQAALFALRAQRADSRLPALNALKGGQP